MTVATVGQSLSNDWMIELAETWTSAHKENSEQMLEKKFPATKPTDNAQKVIYRGAWFRAEVPAV